MKSTLLLPLVAALLVSACASTETEKQAADYQAYIADQNLEALERITSFRFHDWRSLDDEHLIISTSFSNPYLVTLKRRCVDLADSHVIGIDNRGSVLVAGFDAVYVMSRPENRCQIKSIHALTREQADELVRLP